MNAWEYSWGDSWADAWGVQEEVVEVSVSAAIMTKCLGSSLSDDVGGRIFCDEAPDETEFPYIVFFIVTNIQDDTFVEKLEEITVQFSLYSTSNGLSEITTMYSDLRSLFDGQLLNLSEDTCIWMVRQNLATMFDDITTPQGTVGLRHWAVDYSILVQLA